MNGGQINYDIIIVWENFSVKNFRMQSGVRKLNTPNMFYSEIFTVRKNHVYMRKHVPACTTYGQCSIIRHVIAKFSRKCRHVVAITWSSLC